MKKEAIVRKMIDGPVFWQQGLFLQPQHFQYTDLRVEALLGHLASVSRPWLWGVQSIAVDMGALAAGTFSLTAFAGFFPESGVRLSMPGNAICAGRVIPKEIVPVGDSFVVYLALSLMRPDGGNAVVVDSTEELFGLGCRYGVLTGQGELADQYESGPEAQVKRMTTVLRVVFGPEAEQTPDAVLLPVAKLTRGSEGCTLDETYAPPCLSLENSPALTTIFKEVRDRVIGKTRQMDSYKGLALRGGHMEQTGLLMILRSLSRYAARFELFADTPKISPWEAYALLRETVAELSVFSREYNPLGEDSQGNSRILPYSHEDPAPSYLSLREIIVQLLDGLSTGPKYMIRLDNEPPFWQASLPSHVFDGAKRNSEYWLVLRSDSANLTALDAKHFSGVKIGPAKSMHTLLAHAVPGIPFTPDTNTPLGLPQQSGAIFLSLHKDSPMWAELEKQGGICLDWKEAPSDLEVHFAVLGG